MLKNTGKIYLIYHLIPVRPSTHMREVALGLGLDLTRNRGEQYSQTRHSTLRVQKDQEGYGILCSPSLPNKPAVEHAKIQQNKR